MTHPSQFYQLRSCEQKRRYETQADAQSAAWKMAPHVYRCAFCGGWHLASKRHTNDPVSRLTRQDGPFAGLAALRGLA